MLYISPHPELSDPNNVPLPIQRQPLYAFFTQPNSAVSHKPFWIPTLVSMQLRTPKQLMQHKIDNAIQHTSCNSPG